MDKNSWMVRFDSNGKARKGFQWSPVGEWTEAPDWDATPVCGGGLHGQGPGGYGYAQSGTRFVFCEIDSDWVQIGGDKIKARRARILAVDGDAWAMLLDHCTNGLWFGSLYLEGYNHPLPEGFTSCGGSLYL